MLALSCVVERFLGYVIFQIRSRTILIMKLISIRCTKLIEITKVCLKVLIDYHRYETCVY